MATAQSLATEDKESDSDLALVFPGQGSQAIQMLDGIKEGEGFVERYRIVCDCLGFDVLERHARGDGDALNDNLVSALTTVLVSSVSLDLYMMRSKQAPRCVAGYSVGQWSAMYAANMVSFEQLITLIATHARLMDECARREPGAMCAVIGLGEAVVESVAQELRSEGYSIFIANYNCAGQYSLSGTTAAITLIMEKLAGMKPKKLLRLVVDGPWHCPMMLDAERAFYDALQDVEFSAAKYSVIDNVTGSPLPGEITALRQTLARHLSHAVRWDSCVKTMIAAGCNRVVEIGYGDVLTKFGFFIDRRTDFSSFYA